jgi:Rrf2 family protein
MNNVLRISEAVGIALHAMGLLAGEPRAVIRTAQAARLLDVSEAHLSKVLQRLAHAGLVESLRGPKGGFRLARRPRDIRLMDIYVAVDGPMPQCACLLGRQRCLAGGCLLGSLANRVNTQVHEYFTRTRLSDLAPGFAALGAA